METFSKDIYLSPIPSVADVATLPSQMRAALSRVWTYYQQGDYEGLRDNLILLGQKPISVINTLGNLFVIVWESLPFFNASASYLLPLNFATGGLGALLSITQIYLEAIAFSRVVSFQSQFIHSPAPEEDDLKKVQKWAKKTKTIAETLKGNSAKFTEDKESRLDYIMSLCDYLIALDPCGDPENISKYKNLLNLRIQSLDLHTLQDEISKTDEKSREKLYRRLGVNFVGGVEKNLAEQIEKLDELISSRSIEDLEEIETAAEAILKSMHIQLDKRKIAHNIGYWGGVIVLAGVILSIFFPPIGLALILLGSVIGIARFLFWIGYSESKDWNFELGQWAKLQLNHLQSKIIELKEPLLSAFPQESFWAGGTL